MKRFTTLSAAALGLTLAMTGTAFGNGYEFFAPSGDSNRPLDLVYVGQIRDKSTGKLVRSPAYLMVTEKQTGMTFPFGNDRPGHFRSPDVGAHIKDLGGKVAPDNLEIELIVEGYKTAKLTSVPRKTSGVVEVNFTLEPVSSAAASAAGGAPTNTRSDDASQGEAPASSGEWPWRMALVGFAGVVMVGRAARTLVHRSSTAR
jgi:hypothetical protein